MRTLFSKIFFVCCLIGLLGIGYATYLLYGAKYEGKDQLFEVSAGEGFATVNYHLITAGLISNASIFYRYALYQGAITKLKAGVFNIPHNTSTAEVLTILTQGIPVSIRATIPEGKNIYEIAKILREEEIIADESEFITVATNPEFAQSLGIPSDRVEGYLYPDTYLIGPHTSSEEIIKHMISEFHKHLGSVDLSQSEYPLHKLITLASIVEKETGAAFERPLIAGVFTNRLRKGIRLQSDPTTIYGIFDHYRGNLGKKDLQEKTPYNTYRIDGLPPGPICNPGLDAIKAVLFPGQHNYLYFVSRNDGTHIFSENYEEHTKAVNFFQKNRAQRQGKSWRGLNSTPLPQ